MGGERGRADDGVVPPIIAVPPHPGRKPGGDYRPVDARRELLDAGEQRVAVDDERQRLDDAGIGIGLHRGRERDDAIARHQAVGIEHEHVRVMPAPSRDEIGDVAGLAVMVLGPVTVIDARFRPEPLAKREKGALFRDPDIGMGRVGQDEIIEGSALPRRLNGFADRGERAEGARGRFIVDRHDDGGAPRQPRRSHGRPHPGGQDRHESNHGAGEGERDPREIDGEQGQQQPLQQRRAADRHDAVHFPRAIDRQRRGAPEHHETRQPRRGMALLGQVRIEAGPALEGLRRHGRGPLLRHGGTRRRWRHRMARAGLIGRTVEGRKLEGRRRHSPGVQR